MKFSHLNSQNKKHNLFLNDEERNNKENFDLNCCQCFRGLPMCGHKTTLEKVQMPKRVDYLLGLHIIFYVQRIVNFDLSVNMNDKSWSLS